jgi:hypothetical protein
LGDVCGARNAQFDQEFFGLFLGETVSAYNWRDRIGDFCVAEYLEELDTVHVMRYSTRFGLHLRRKGSGASTCCFEKRREARTQEFVLHWSPTAGGSSRDIVRQQYHFSPSGTSEEIQVYRVELEDVVALEITIIPNQAAVTHTPPLRSCSSRAMVNSWQS